MLAALDAAIGRVLRAVDELGSRDNTLVVLMSDNGASVSPKNGANVASNGPLRDGYATSYEGGIRVPALARWPERIPGGTICNAPLLSMDIPLPTFVAAAGGTLPTNRVLDGIDLGPLLAGSPAPPREMFWQFRKFSAVRSGSWKLVRSDPKKSWELYDLDHDIGEHDDLAAKNPEVVKKLADDFDRWLDATERPTDVLSDEDLRAEVPCPRL